MTSDVRAPREEDRAQVVELLRSSLNFNQAWVDGRGATMPLENHRSVYEGGRIVATAAGIGFRQWLGYMDRDDPAAPQLARLFAGSDPWCPFFF
jgi:hypothetical protein